MANSLLHVDRNDDWSDARRRGVSFCWVYLSRRRDQLSFPSSPSVQPRLSNCSKVQQLLRRQLCMTIPPMGIASRARRPTRSTTNRTNDIRNIVALPKDARIQNYIGTFVRNMYGARLEQVLCGHKRHHEHVTDDLPPNIVTENWDKDDSQQTQLNGAADGGSKLPHFEPNTVPPTHRCHHEYKYAANNELSNRYGGRPSEIQLLHCVADCFARCFCELEDSTPRRCDCA
jgi:hypothetical protein